MKKSILGIAAASLSMVASSATFSIDSYLFSGARTDTAFAQYCYENDELVEIVDAAQQVVDPVGLVKRESGKSNTYRIVRRPEGMDIERWVLLVRTEETRNVRPATEVSDENPAREYQGDSITIPGDNSQAGFSHWDKYLFVVPCFSWLEYDLVYDRNDGTGNSLRDLPSTHLSTNRIELAACPDAWKRKGHDFVGWSAAPDGGTVFAASNSVTGVELGAVTNGPFRLYAHWRLRDLDIRLDYGDGGATEDGRLVVHVGEAWSLPKPERAHFTFLGWYTDRDGGDRIEDGDEVVRDDLEALYAHWEADTFEVIVGSSNPRQGSVWPNGLLEREYNVSLSLRAQAENGYVFRRWSDGHTTASRTVVVTSNSVYWAEFAPHTHAVTFVYRTATGESKRETQEVAHGSRAWPPSDADCKSVAGYDFQAWDNAYDNVTEDITVSARYQAREETVYFLANGGQGRMDPQTFVHGKAEVLSPNAFKCHYRAIVKPAAINGVEQEWTTNIVERAFLGWAAAPDATQSEILYADCEQVTSPAPGGYVALYAVWSPIPEAVSSPASGGKVPGAGETPPAQPQPLSLTPSADGEWEEVEVEGTNVWQASVFRQAPYPELRATVTGPGTLAFDWMGASTPGMTTARSEGVLQTNGVDCVVLAGTGGWTANALQISASDRVELSWVRRNGYAASLRSATWTPGGDGQGGSGAEPEPVDETVYEPVAGDPTAYYHVFDGLCATGEPQTGVVAVAGCTLAGGTAEDAGSHTAWAELDEGWSWFDDSASGRRQVKWKLDRGTYDMSGVRFLDRTLVWDGQPKSLSVAGSLPAGVSVSYSGNGQTDEGVYVVTARFTGDDGNFEAIPPLSATMTIVSPFGGNNDCEPVTDDLAPGKLSHFDAVAEYGGGAAAIDLEQLASAFGAYAISPFSVAFAARENAPVAEWSENAPAISEVGATSFWYRVATKAFGNFVHPIRLVVTPCDMSHVEVAAIADQTWTGKPVTPAVKAVNGFSQAVLGASDFTCSYEDNVEVGTARVVLTGQGNYTGTREVAFTIGKGNFNLGGVVFADATVEADGSAHSLSVSGLPSGAEVAYSENSFVDPGDYLVTATITFAGDGHYLPNSRTLTATLHIVPGDGSPGGDGGGVPGSGSPVAGEELYPSGELGEFTASAASTYDGWLRDSQGRIAGTVSVKTARSRNGAAVRSTVKTQIFGRGRVVRRTTVRPGPEAVDKYGIVYGNLGLGGMFDDYEVIAGRNFAKSRKAADKARAGKMPRGVWTLAFDSAKGTSVFSLTVSAKGKAKVKGTLANGQKVSSSCQGVLGEDDVFAVPFVYMKNGRTAGFVFWIGADGATAVTDVADDSWEDGVVAAYSRPADGTYVSACELPSGREYLEDVDGFDVTPSGIKVKLANGRFAVARAVGRVKYSQKSARPYVDYNASRQKPANLAALKLKLTARTGLVKGSCKLYYVDDGRVRFDKATISGIVVGREVVGSGRVNGRGTFVFNLQ